MTYLLGGSVHHEIKPGEGSVPQKRRDQTTRKSADPFLRINAPPGFSNTRILVDFTLQGNQQRYH